MPKKLKKSSRKSVPKKLILELVLAPQPKPPFFKGSWTATEEGSSKAKKAGTRKRRK